MLLCNGFQKAKAGATSLHTLLLQKPVYEILLPLASHDRGFGYPYTAVRIIDCLLLYPEQSHLHAPLCRHIIICPPPADQETLLPHPFKQPLLLLSCRAAGFLSPASCPLFSPLWGFSCAGIVLYVSTVKRQGWGSIAPSLTNFYNGFSPNPACIILPGFRPSALEIVSGSGSSPTVRIG